MDEGARESIRKSPMLDVAVMVPTTQIAMTRGEWR